MMNSRALEEALQRFHDTLREARKEAGEMMNSRALEEAWKRHDEERRDREADLQAEEDTLP